MDTQKDCSTTAKDSPVVLLIKGTLTGLAIGVIAADIVGAVRVADYGAVGSMVGCSLGLVAANSEAKRRLSKHRND